MLICDFLSLTQLKLPVKVVVFNNGRLGFVELERMSTGFLTTGTDLMNPNFAAMAEAAGVRGIRIEDPGEVDNVVAAALAHNGPVLIDAVVARIAEIGFPLDANPVRGNSIACTGEPHCNFSVAETKTRLDGLIQALEARFGLAIADLRLHLDGCPHACAQHWVGDLGFQGTTARDVEGVRRQAYDIFVRGGLGPDPAIGRSLFRRVPTDELDLAVGGLVAGWLDRRSPGESFTSFTRRTGDEELGELAGLEPARTRQREETDE